MTKDADCDKAAVESDTGAQRWRDAADKLRGRVDLAAKALGGVGTTALTAVGLARIGDLFPVPPGLAPAIWFTLALIGFAGLAAAVFLVTRRLWSVHKPIFMRTDPDAMRMQEDLDDGELHQVRLVYQEAADLNDVPSLRAYEARGHRLTRIAARTADEAERQRLEKLTASIHTDIQAVFARAALRVIRKRTTAAVLGHGTKTTFLLFVAGIFLFALGTDYVVSERSERVTIAKSCAEARSAGALELPAICGEPPGDEPQETSPTQERAIAAGALQEPLQRCLGIVDAGDAPAGSCDPIAEAISSLITGGGPPSPD